MPPFDLPRTAIQRSAIAGCLTALLQHLAFRALGHPKRFADLAVSAMVGTIIVYVTECYVQPWLARRREVDEEKRATLDRWRLN